MLRAMNRATTFAFAFAFALAGCSTTIQLTAEGELVRVVSDAEIPGGCNLLGDVAVGIPPDAAQPPTRDELVSLLRNKAALNGATHLAVDQAQEHTGEAGMVWWRGRARGYACPAGASSDAAASSGGEASGDSTDAEDADAEDADAADADLEGSEDSEE